MSARWWARKTLTNYAQKSNSNSTAMAKSKVNQRHPPAGGDSRENRTFAGSARRAVRGCAPYKLPADKYDTWADVVVNFSLKDML